MNIALLLVAFILVNAASASADTIGPETLQKNCASDAMSSTAFDCDCLVAKLKEIYAKEGSGKWENAYVILGLSEGKKCVQPDRIHAQVLKNCTEKGYDLNKRMDKNGLGKEQFCQCVADESIKRIPKASMERIQYLTTDTERAMISCSSMK